MAVNFPSNPTNGQTITANGITYAYDSTQGVWSDNPQGLTQAIDALTDVDTSTSAPTNGQILQWNSTDSEWQPADLSSYTVYALSGTAIDPTNGGIQTKTLAANTTFTETLASGESVVLMLVAGASYTITWPTITWVTASGNSAPTLTANDTIVLWKVSTTLYGAYVGSYA